MREGWRDAEVTCRKAAIPPSPKYQLRPNTAAAGPTGPLPALPEDTGAARPSRADQGGRGCRRRRRPPARDAAAGQNYDVGVPEPARGTCPPYH